MTAEWAVGDVILEHYEVREVIRRGGMGVVHRVHHRGWDTDFAVKTPRPEVVREAGGREAFEREAATWVRLGVHPHIVACVFVRRLDGLPRVFAEWVGGGSLADTVAAGRFGPDRPAAVLDTAVQIAWGLAYAHARGLVHQDVKPANVLLEPDGTAKVTDFGLARVAGADVLVSYAGRTPAYCSPEQARAAAGAPQPLTAATDVWSWALCVLEMAIGAPPTRHGQAGAEVLERFAGGPALPAPLTELLRRCFRPDPADRPAMAAVADELVAVHAAVTGTPYPRTRPPVTGPLAGGWSNQALSLLELGDVAGAEEAWQAAARLEPGHPHTVYNHGLHRWRTGRITDEQLVARLGAVAADPVGRRLLDQVRRERGSGPPGPTVAFGGHRGRVTAVATDRAGSVALSGDDRGAVLLWAPGDGRMLRRLARRGAPVVAVAVDRLGRAGLAARADGATEVWDLGTGRRTTVLGWDTGASDCVAISGDGRTALTTAPDGTIFVWDATDGARTGELTRHAAPVRALAVSDDGTRAVSAAFAGRTGEVVSWTIPGATVHCSSAGNDAAVSRDARLALVVADDGGLVLWDARSGRARHTARPPGPPAGDVRALGPDGRLLLTAGPGVARFRTTDTGRSLHTLPGAGDVRRAAFSGDGRLVLLAGGDGVRVYPVPPADYRAPWSYAP